MNARIQRKFTFGRVLLATGSLIGAGSVVGLGGASATTSHVAKNPYSNETINVGVAQLPPLGGDPFAGSQSPQSFALSAIYNSLTTVNNAGVVEPSLATAWKETSPLTWSVTLRKGVKFSDGEPFNSTAVVDALNYVSTNSVGETSSTGAIFAPIVASVVATGTYGVTITLKAPDIILPQLFSQIYIPAPNVFTTVGETGLKTDPVGTGPFVVTSLGATQISMRAFKASWQKPKVGFVNVIALPTSASRLQALQSGQVQLAVSLDPGQIPLANTSTTEAKVSQVAQVMSLAFINNPAATTSTAITAMSNPLVRQALNYAVDKVAIGKALLFGKGKPISQGAIPGVLGYNPKLTPYTYDPTKAKALLAQAGYPNGFNLTADVIVGSFPNDGAIYQAMANDFDAIGVNTTLVSVTFATWLGSYLSGKWGAAAAYGLSWNALFTNDITTSMNSFTCLRSPAVFCDPTTASDLKSAEQVNNLKARALRIETVAKDMYDNPPAVWLTTQVDINGISKALVGYANLRRSFPYATMYLTKK
jgi:peptide/nickel transport system substrate-binding protein